MILLKISNASELVASKIGKFLESLTPDGLDQTTVEDAVISKLIENLRAEGIKGEVAAVRGLDLDAKQLVLDESTKVRRHDHF
jgi:ABC-type iron transport system FetAB ATPase subunit